MAETAGKTNALETEWSRPNMSLFFDDTLDIVTESDSSDSDDGDLTDDAIVRMDTSHDYFQLGGNFPASKDKEEKDSKENKIKNSDVDSNIKDDENNKTEKSPDGRLIPVNQRKSSIANRLVLFTSRYGRPPTSEETVQLLEGTLHMDESEEEEAARLMKEKEKRDQKLKDKETSELQLHLEAVKQKAIDRHRENAFDGDHEKHEEHMQKAEEDVEVAKKRKEQERLKKQQELLKKNNPSKEDDGKEEEKNETKESTISIQINRKIVIDNKNSNDEKNVTQDDNDNSNNNSNENSNENNNEKKVQKNDVQTDIDKNDKNVEEEKVMTKKNSLISPERLLQSKWNFAKRSRKKAERAKLKKKRVEEERKKANLKKLEDDRKKRLIEQRKLEEEKQRKAAEERKQLEIENKKAEEEKRRIEEELRVAKEKRKKLEQENKRIAEENKQKKEEAERLRQEKLKEEALRAEINKDTEEELRHDYTLNKLNTPLKQSIVEATADSKNSLNNDITDPMFEAGSIVPQRPKGIKNSRVRPQSAQNIRNTRMSRRRKATLNNETVASSNVNQNAGKIKRGHSNRKRPSSASINRKRPSSASKVNKKRSSSASTPQSNIHGRPELPARINLNQRPSTSDGTNRRNKRQSYSKSVLDSRRSRNSSPGFRRKLSPRQQKKKLKRKQLLRTKTLEKNWVDPISSSPLPVLASPPPNGYGNLPRRPQSARRFKRSQTSPRRGGAVFKSNDRNVTIDWRQFDNNKVGNRRKGGSKIYSQLQSGGDHRGSTLIEVFPHHPTVEKCRSSLLSAVETWGRKSNQVDRAARALCKAYNASVMQYLASRVAKSKILDKEKKGRNNRNTAAVSSASNMMNENITNNMLSRALRLSETKGFLCSSEKARIRFRSTTLNNIACFHSACGRPRMAIRALWEARLLSWDEQQDRKITKDTLDGPEIRTMLNMSSIYNRIGEYGKSLKVLVKVCNSLRKTANGSGINENSSGSDMLPTNQLELLPIALYSKGCTHEHLQQWHKATRCFSEGLDHATRLLGTDHSLVHQLAVAYDEAKKEMGLMQSKREQRRRRMGKRYSKKTVGKSLSHNI